MGGADPTDLVNGSSKTYYVERAARLGVR